MVKLICWVALRPYWCLCVCFLLHRENMSSFIVALTSYSYVTLLGATNVTPCILTSWVEIIHILYIEIGLQDKEFKLLYCAAPVGSTPALSKMALCTWLDNLITGIAKEDPKVYNNSGTREDGTYHLLKQSLEKSFGCSLTYISGQRNAMLYLCLVDHSTWSYLVEGGKLPRNRLPVVHLFKELCVSNQSTWLCLYVRYQNKYMLNIINSHHVAGSE